MNGLNPEQLKVLANNNMRCFLYRTRTGSACLRLRAPYHNFMCIQSRITPIHGVMYSQVYCIQRIDHVTK